MAEIPPSAFAAQFHRVACPCPWLSRDGGDVSAQKRSDIYIGMGSDSGSVATTVRMGDVGDDTASARLAAYSTAEGMPPATSCQTQSIRQHTGNEQSGSGAGVLVVSYWWYSVSNKPGASVPSHAGSGYDRSSPMSSAIDASRGQLGHGPLYTASAGRGK